MSVHDAVPHQTARTDVDDGNAGTNRESEPTVRDPSTETANDHLFADEPCSGLDLIHVTTVRHVFRRRNSNIGTVRDPNIRDERPARRG
jgi:hypothetical protein